MGFYYILKASIDGSFMGSLFSIGVSYFDTCFEGDFLLLLFLLSLVLFYLLNYDYNLSLFFRYFI
jgi:hypothetical protein